MIRCTVPLNIYHPHSCISRRWSTCCVFMGASRYNDVKCCICHVNIHQCSYTCATKAFIHHFCLSNGKTVQFHKQPGTTELTEQSTKSNVETVDGPVRITTIRTFCGHIPISYGIISVSVMGETYNKCRRSVKLRFRPIVYSQRWSWNAPVPIQTLRMSPHQGLRLGR